MYHYPLQWVPSMYIITFSCRRKNDFTTTRFELERHSPRAETRVAHRPYINQLNIHARRRGNDSPSDRKQYAVP